jgi:hypothetical protein
LGEKPGAGSDRRRAVAAAADSEQPNQSISPPVGRISVSTSCGMGLGGVPDRRRPGPPSSAPGCGGRAWQRPGQSVATPISISHSDVAASICHTSGFGHPKGPYTSTGGRERARRTGSRSVRKPEGGENRNSRSGINPTDPSRRQVGGVPRQATAREYGLHHGRLPVPLGDSTGAMCSSCRAEHAIYNRIPVPR